MQLLLIAGPASVDPRRATRSRGQERWNGVLRAAHRDPPASDLLGSMQRLVRHSN